MVTGTVRPVGKRARVADDTFGIRLAELDLRESSAIPAVLESVHPEIVIHAAWSGVDNASRSDRSQISDNVPASCALIEACIQAGVRKFVGIGSQAEYGRLAGRISERTPTEPTSLYGSAKLAVMRLSSQLAAQSGMPFAWMRLFSTYGPGDNANWLIPSLVEQMLDGKRPRTTLGTQLWDYLYIDDVASGILAVANEERATGTFNLGSGEPVPVRSIVEAIRDRVAPAMALVFGEIPFGPTQIMHMEADITRIKDLANWSPRVDLATGLDLTIAAHRRSRAQAATTNA